ncbi:DNA-processing protein DprA [uncultured Methanobrevibacter sp.]|uniref:DNA-processing protein DprA n=1 Tax=uncultured Methanobrevibacter sp. TaxID=253161 RepID=UPI00262E3A5C|nr:DNA-processing protein DprA [uncultured Methanobrevibacter sp.]
MEKFKEIIFLKNLKRVGKATIYGKYWNLLINSKGLDDLILSFLKFESKFTNEDLQKAKYSAEELYDYVINSEIEVITVFDENYPKQLLDMGNKRPLILYVKGDVEVLAKPNIAVIGTRMPSKLSQEFEEQLVKSIVNESNRVIISGLALGCDKIAHQTTINENKLTIAILPSGVNVIKPAKHKKLAEEIIANGGCLISEYDPDKTAYKSTYIERDQIVAAFSDATFVVECGVKSGTMHTVNAAKKFNKQIFSYLPNDMTNGAYDGNKFILENNFNAVPVKSIDEFLDDLENINQDKHVSKQQSLI